MHGQGPHGCRAQQALGTAPPGLQPAVWGDPASGYSPGIIFVLFCSTNGHGGCDGECEDIFNLLSGFINFVDFVIDVASVRWWASCPAWHFRRYEQWDFR